MKKLATGILVTTALILFISFAFTLYAQFALDYSLETLKQALQVSQQVSQKEISTPLGSQFYYSSTLERLAFLEIGQREADLKNVIFLDHAARSIRDAVEQSGYARASVYLNEVLREKLIQRSWYLRIGDSLYSFIQSFIKWFRNLWNYAMNRTRSEMSIPPLRGDGLLLLAEAEKMERDGRLSEAERYYREFLNRYPRRPERGFVSISLAYLLIRMKRLEEADELLQTTRKEFVGTKEEIIATDLLTRIEEVKKRLARLPQLENWVRSQPEKIFEETGGLELALGYLMTYQMDKAIAILKKFEEVSDPQLRAKALFYQGWIHKWQGELEKGKNLFQALSREADLDRDWKLALQAGLAATHREAREYEEALRRYEELSLAALERSWSTLAEIEKNSIYLSDLGKIELARERIQKLMSASSEKSIEFRALQLQLQETFQKEMKERAFVAFAEGRIDLALQDIQNYLEKFPQDATAHSALASAYLLRGLLKEAIGAAEMGYALERSEYTAAVLGYIFEKSGKISEAEEYYSISMAQDPLNPTSRYNLARIYLLTGRYKEADRLLIQLEKEAKFSLAPTVQAKILNNRGCALWLLGKKEEAMEKFEHALRISPGFIEAQKNLQLGFGEKPNPAALDNPPL